MSKTGGTATLAGDINGAALTVNGSGGTLNLGIGLTHTFTGVVTLTAGSLNGGSSKLRENSVSASAWNGTGSVFTPASSTVEFGGAGNQTLSASSLSFNQLSLSGSGNKVFSSAVTVSGNISISGTAVANLGSITTHAANSLTLGGANQAGGSWGSTASAALNTNNTYFLSSVSGILNVNCTAPVAPTSGGNQTICNGETIPELSVTTPGGSTADWYSQAAGGTLLIAGSLTYTPSAGGTFYAESRVISGGCISASRTAVILNVNANPAQLALTGSSICASPGNNGTIVSSASVVGIEYQLYNSSNAPLGSVKNGTGSGLSWTGISAATGYYVKGTNTTTSCTSTSSTVDISTYATRHFSVNRKYYLCIPWK
ncbi:MAG: hypothetical protein IPP73_12545 [Chitinophagaceae bacterium]|nr:hypothetical protein [Chitinophagaceae bacterium]